MARILRRNLFSTLVTSSPITDTIISSCREFCDPSCSNFEDCYTFSGSIHPLAPLPPPLPPVSIIVSPDTITTQGVHISPLVIIIVIVLATIFLVISYYAIIVKYCTFWNNRRSIGRDTLGTNSDQGDVHGLIHESEDNNDPIIDHPIWLISTIGLHQSVINAITTLHYKKDDGLIDGTDCSVCLSEFQEEEILRLLPKCKHAFHIDCIDTWLRSHINCPLCRAGIVANSGRPSLASNDPSFGHSRRVEFVPIVDSDSSDIELGRSHRGNNSGIIENVQNDNIDRNSVENKDEVDFNSIIRRSFSMDCFRSRNFRNVNDSNSSTTRGVDSSPQGPPLIKRSYSWSERVFWSSRNQIHCNGNLSP